MSQFTRKYNGYVIVILPSQVQRKYAYNTLFKRKQITDALEYLGKHDSYIISPREEYVKDHIAIRAARELVEKAKLVAA